MPTQQGDGGFLRAGSSAASTLQRQLSPGQSLHHEASYQLPAYTQATRHRHVHFPSATHWNICKLVLALWRDVATDCCLCTVCVCVCVLVCMTKGRKVFVSPPLFAPLLLPPVLLNIETEEARQRNRPYCSGIPPLRLENEIREQQN